MTAGCSFTNEPVYFENYKENLTQAGSAGSENSQENVSLQPYEDALRTDPERSFFEWWYFDASFEDGSSAVIVFATKDIINPKGKLDPIADIVITDSDGNRVSYSDRPGAGSFRASGEHLDTAVGESRVSGDLNNIKVFYNAAGITARLNFKSAAPAWKPAGGKLVFGKKKDKYFGWLPAMPYAEVEGTLNYNGKDINVKGHGYHDHNWGNVKLSEVLSQWYWGRARIGDKTVIFSEMLTAPKYGSLKIPVFYFAEGNKIISSSDYNMLLQPSDWNTNKDGHDYPERLDVEINDSDNSFNFAITGDKIIDEKNLLEQLSPLVQRLASLFVRPYYFRFDSSYSVEYDGQIYEGRGIYELMVLRGKQTIR